MSNQAELQKAVNAIAASALMIYEALTPGTSIVVKVPGRTAKIITSDGHGNDAGGTIIITRPVICHEFKAIANKQEAQHNVQG